MVQLAIDLNGKIVPQHASPVKYVNRELLRQSIRLVAHDHPNSEVAHLSVFGNRAGPG